MGLNRNASGIDRGSAARKSERQQQVPRWTLIKTQTSYAVEVPKNRAHALFTLEPISLLDMLMKINGVRAVEYDAHFGPFVYVTLDALVDSPELHAAVGKVIQSGLDKVQGARRP